MDRMGLIVAGEERDALSGGVFESMDPSTGGPLAVVARGGVDDIDAAVAHGQHHSAEPGIDEAARLANATAFGINAGVWTTDVNKALHFAGRIRAGQVYVNTYGAGGGVELPFGGYKKNGFGREKGLEALGSCLQATNVFIKLDVGAA